MAVTGATLRKSMKTFKAGNRKFAAGVSKLHKDADKIKAGKAPMNNDDVKGAAKYYPKKQIAEIRTQEFRPKSMRADMAQASAYARGQGKIKHPKNAWRQPQLAPHQTSSWTKQKSPTDVGNYLAWKYKGFPKGGY